MYVHINMKGETYSIAVRHICLKFLVIGILYVNRATSKVGHARREVVHHLHGRWLICHLQESLKQKYKNNFSWDSLRDITYTRGQLFSTYLCRPNLTN